MSIETVFIVQLASIFAYIGTLFYLYRLLVSAKDAQISQKDAQIDLLRDELKRVEAQSPLQATEVLDRRYKLTEEALEWASKEREQLSKEREQLSKEREQLSNDLRKATEAIEYLNNIQGPEIRRQTTDLVGLKAKMNKGESETAQQKLEIEHLEAELRHREAEIVSLKAATQRQKAEIEEQKAGMESLEVRLKKMYLLIEKLVLLLS